MAISFEIELSDEEKGHGPGTVLELADGDKLGIRARVKAPGAEHLSLVGPDGVMTESDTGAELRFDTTLTDGPTWIAAVARGPGHPNTLDKSVFAHTTPVYIEVAGQPVARSGAARWCLAFLDRLEEFVDQHGHFESDTRTAHFGDFVAVVDQGRALYRRVAESADRSPSRRA